MITLTITEQAKIMKKISQYCLLTTFCFVLVACSSAIDIKQYPKATMSNYTSNLPAPSGLSLSIIKTAFGNSREGLVYSGGSMFKTRKLSHIAVLIQHPKGTFVFDTGLGKQAEAQFQKHFDFLAKQLLSFTRVDTLYNVLEKNNFSPSKIDFIIPSHLHWDHASGIEDFPNAKVWITNKEHEAATDAKAKPPAFIKEQYDASTVKWNFFNFNDIPYEVFEKSYDVFDDGSIILVPLYGHTKGSIGMFVNLKSNKRYFFTGDLTWVAEGFEGPYEKNFLAKIMIDSEPEKVTAQIVKVHQLVKLKPQIILVPAHDANAQKDMAHFPNVEY